MHFNHVPVTMLSMLHFPQYFFGIDSMLIIPILQIRRLKFGEWSSMSVEDMKEPSISSYPLLLGP